MTNQAVVFDFGSVLFNVDTQGMYLDHFLATGRTAEDSEFFLTHILTRPIRSMSNKGALTPVLNELAAQHPEWAEDILAYGPTRDFMKQIKGTIEGMPEVLQDIKGAKIPLYGLTNWSSDGFKALEEAYPDIIKMFDKIVVSGEINMRKPEPQIFEFANRAFGVSAEQTVFFFDDQAHNVKASQDVVGWKGQLFQNAATTRKVIGI